MAKKQGLGRGLKSLISEETISSIQDSGTAGGKDPLIFELDLHKIRPNQNQPRKQFDRETLEELASSIEEHGILQPLVVRPEDGGYTIIAGERRFRAAGIAGLKTVPVIIRDLDPKSVLEIAIIENVQRENLNPLEEAMAYDQLMKTFGLSQTDVAKRIGKNRSSVANTLRILKLPQPVQNLLLKDLLTFGHAKALMGLTEDEKIIALADKIVEHDLSVRETEKIVQGEKVKKTKTQEKNIPIPKDPYLVDCEDRLRNLFASNVIINGNGKKGNITINYHSESDFNRIFEILNAAGGQNET